MVLFRYDKDCNFYKIEGFWVNLGLRSQAIQAMLSSQGSAAGIQSSADKPSHAFPLKVSFFPYLNLWFSISSHG